jgi:polysaccharide biosynthesis/export protein
MFGARFAERPKMVTRQWGKALGRLSPFNPEKRSMATRSMVIIVCFAAVLGGLICAAQQPLSEPVSNRTAPPERKPEIKDGVPARDKREITSGYILGPGDQIAIHAVNFEEINDKPIAIDLSGSIRLPMVGRIPVSGLTIEQVGSEIAKRLETYVKHPDVSVSVAEFRSQPVSVIGAVKNPGVQQVQGQKTLVEMLSLAGGLDTTTAGSTLKITRRLEWGRIPLPGAITDPTNQFSVAQVSVKSLLEAKTPEENVLVKPYDVISVPRGETVYVIGEVLKAGGFLLNDSEQVTVLQALSMAGGMDKMAQPQNARILRRIPGASSRTEIAVDLNKILGGKTPDVRMQAEDILFVPNSVPKRAALRALEAAIQMGTGIAVFHR